MSLYILDTDTLQLFQDEHPLLAALVLSVALADRAISVVSVEEQLSGWYTQLRHAKRPERLAWAYRRLAATVRFLSRVQIVDFDEAAIQRCEQLKKRKVKVGTNDLRIARNGTRTGCDSCDAQRPRLPEDSRSAHRRLVEVSEQMLSLHKQLAVAKTPQDQTMLQRQIDAIDRQIDWLP